MITFSQIPTIIFPRYNITINTAFATSKSEMATNFGKIENSFKLSKFMKMFLNYCGNHDMQKKNCGPLFRDFPCYEGIILKPEFPTENRHFAMEYDISNGLYITHGHQADLLNSVFWRLSRFLVRYLWTPLERFGVLDPTSAAKNNIKKEKLEKKYISYAKEENCLLLTGHTHRPTIGNRQSPYYNCGSCVHPKCITCIELCGFQISLVKWYASAQKSEHFGTIYRECPPVYPLYVKREVLATENLLSQATTPLFL